MDICEEALISRATFYAHFDDKYDLLKYWLTSLFKKTVIKDYSFEKIEQTVNGYINKNKKIINNVIGNINEETFNLLVEWTSLNLFMLKEGDRNYAEKALTHRIFAGGLVYYLIWQQRNKFPNDIPVMNKDVYNIIINMIEKVQDDYS